MDDHNTAYDLRRILADTIAENGRVKAQRDELAAALKNLVVAIKHDDKQNEGSRASVVDAVLAARAALAKLGKEAEEEKGRRE